MTMQPTIEELRQIRDEVMPGEEYSRLQAIGYASGRLPLPVSSHERRPAPDGDAVPEGYSHVRVGVRPDLFDGNGQRVVRRWFPGIAIGTDGVVLAVAPTDDDPRHPDCKPGATWVGYSTRIGRNTLARLKADSYLVVEPATADDLVEHRDPASPEARIDKLTDENRVLRTELERLKADHADLRQAILTEGDRPPRPRRG